MSTSLVTAQSFYTTRRTRQVVIVLHRGATRHPCFVSTSDNLTRHRILIIR